MFSEEDIERGVKQTLELMSEKSPDQLCDVLIAIDKNIERVRVYYYSAEQHLQFLGDKVAELGGGRTFMEYLRFLWDQDLSNEPAYHCFCGVLTCLWNETDANMKLSLALAENGLFELLSNELTWLKTRLSSNKQV